MQRFLNQAPDLSTPFGDMQHEFFLPGKVTAFDPVTKRGVLEWEKHVLQLDWAFNTIRNKLVRGTGKEMPPEEYDVDLRAPWSLSFVSERTIRLRMESSASARRVPDSPMLVGAAGEPVDWQWEEDENTFIFRSVHGGVRLGKKNWGLTLLDRTGRPLTQTLTRADQKSLHHKYTPFCFLRNSRNYARQFAATFSLAYDEKLYGCGESFTRLNKRSQKLHLWSTDAQSAATPALYKPVPFFLSSRGYGLFVHSAAPMTFDLGHTYDGANSLFLGDDHLDLFIFIGNPREILAEYTALTGRSPMPPPWSFGLWMSKLSFTSQTEVEEAGRKLRQHRIPCDVLHVDAGWFAKGFACDFRFGASFPDPRAMIGKLRESGFRVSLWQLPYFTAKNPLYEEILRENLYIQDGKGEVPTDDAILDLTNPRALTWYAAKIKSLLDLGVSAIKADFGEAAPPEGIYHNGRTTTCHARTHH